MIIARIIPCAGMGNQMFMYAAGLVAASRLNTELRLGAWDWEIATRKDRPWELSCFPAITEQNASFRETMQVSFGLAVLTTMMHKPIKKYNLPARLICKIISISHTAPINHSDVVKRYKASQFPYPYKFTRIHIEDNSYKDRFDEVPDNTCLVGYWESEDYFADYADVVRERFRFAPECFDPQWSSQVKACNSVALHVRRTDKVREDDSQASNLGYLTRALDKICSMTDNPEFFVFSDDINWCRENLHKARDFNYHFVEGQTVAQDLALMSICKHVIMGPSTFSWWGAWLNENPNKIIIAPKREDANLSWYPRGSIIV